MNFIRKAIRKLISKLSGKEPSKHVLLMKCPYCNADLVDAWAEGSGIDERFFILHPDPGCRLCDNVVEVFPLTNGEREAFRNRSNRIKGTKILRIRSF